MKYGTVMQHAMGLYSFDMVSPDDQAERPLVAYCLQFHTGLNWTFL